MICEDKQAIVTKSQDVSRLIQKPESRKDSEKNAVFHQKAGNKQDTGKKN